MYSEVDFLELSPTSTPPTSTASTTPPTSTPPRSAPQTSPKKFPHWNDYVKDTDILSIAISREMLGLINYPAVRVHLSQKDIATYEKWGSVSGASEFQKYAGSVLNSELFIGVVDFLAEKGYVIGVPKNRDVNSEDYPVELYNPRVQKEELGKRLNPSFGAICPKDADEFPRCLENTRTSLIDAIVSRVTAKDAPTQPLLVLGSTGTGKSAIAASVIDTLQTKGVPVFSFVCKHDVPDRSDPRQIVPTLAWQLAGSLPHRSGVENGLAQLKDLEIITALPSQQIELLVPDPDQRLAQEQRPVLVIDALDESGLPERRQQLIKALVGKKLEICSHLVVLIFTRPVKEVHADLLSHADTVVDLDSLLRSDETTDDMRHFFLSELEEDIATAETVSKLVRVANGIFVWARVVSWYIRDFDDFEQQQETLRELCGGTPLADDGLKPLYDLYRRTIKSCLVRRSNANPIKPNLELFRAIVAAIRSTEVPLSESSIAWLTGKNKDTVEGHLLYLRPLLAPRVTAKQPVRLLHASVDDFFQSLEGKDDLHAPPQHRDYVDRCFDKMDSSLSFNIANITNPRRTIAQSSEMEVYRENFDESLRYATLHWSWHVAKLPPDVVEEVLTKVERFFGKSFLHWLEVLSIFGEVYGGLNALEVLVGCAKGFLLDIVEEAARLLQHHRIQIQKSPCHVYLSVLPVASNYSTFAEFWNHRIPVTHLPRIYLGGDNSWPNKISIPLSSQIEHLEFSPVGNKVLTLEASHVRIFDARTGHQPVGLVADFPDDLLFAQFSADGKRVFAMSTKYRFNVWDASSGAILDAFDGNVDWKYVRILLLSDSLYAVSSQQVFRVRDLRSDYMEYELPMGGPKAFKLLRYMGSSRDGTVIVSVMECRGSIDKPVLHALVSPSPPNEFKEVEIPKQVLRKYKPLSVAICSNGSKIALLYPDSVVLWNRITAAASTITKSAASATFCALAIDALGTRVAVATAGTVEVWDAASPSRHLHTFHQSARHLSFSACGTLLAIGKDHCLDIRSVEATQVDTRLDQGCIDSAAFSKDGLQLIVVPSRGAAQRWDLSRTEKALEDFRPIGFEKHPAQASPQHLIISPSDPNRVVFCTPHTKRHASRRQTISCWDTVQCQMLWEVPCSDLGNIEYSPDGAHLCRVEMRKVEVLDARNGDLLASWESRPDGYQAITISPDGKRICGVETTSGRVTPRVTLVVWKFLSHPGEPEVLSRSAMITIAPCPSTNRLHPPSWSADGRSIFTLSQNPEGEAVLSKWNAEAEVISLISRRKFSVPLDIQRSPYDYSMWTSRQASLSSNVSALADQLEITNLDDRWRSLLSVAGGVGVTEFEREDGSKLEVVDRSGHPLVVEYPSSDPWKNFCDAMHCGSTAQPEEAPLGLKAFYETSRSKKLAVDIARQLALQTPPVKEAARAPAEASVKAAAKRGKRKIVAVEILDQDSNEQEEGPRRSKRGRK